MPVGRRHVTSTWMEVTLGAKLQRDLPRGWPTLATGRDVWKGVVR